VATGVGEGVAVVVKPEVGEGVKRGEEVGVGGVVMAEQPETARYRIRLIQCSCFRTTDMIERLYLRTLKPRRGVK
jgi:hypothetical protein